MVDRARAAFRGLRRARCCPTARPSAQRDRQRLSLHRYLVLSTGRQRPGVGHAGDLVKKRGGIDLVVNQFEVLHVSPFDKTWRRSPDC